MPNTGTEKRSQKKSLSEFQTDLICGSFGGVANWASGHPFDSIKVRMQRAEGSRVSMFGIMSSTFRREGLRGFYKGGTPPLFFIPPINSAMFASYEFAKRQLGVQPGGEITPMQNIIAGGFTGIVTAFIISPIELVKCRLQLQFQNKNQAYYKGPIDCMLKIWREEEALRGIFKGLVPTIIRELPANIFQFLGYEFGKNLMMKLRFDKSQEENLVPRRYEQFIAGGIAGLSWWVASYPQDIIKTKLQTQHAGGSQNVQVIYDKYQIGQSLRLPDGGAINCAKSIYEANGLRGFWIGFSAWATRAVIANAFLFMAYEYAQGQLRRYTGSDNQN